MKVRQQERGRKCENKGHGDWGAGIKRRKLSVEDKVTEGQAAWEGEMGV